MRRFLFVIIMALVAFSGLNAQVSPVKRPSKGAVSVELQFNPFSQSGNTFSMDGLKIKYFVTDIDAIRFKLGFLYNREIEKSVSVLDGNFKFDIGYERHLSLAKRIDFYFGPQIGIEKGYARTTGTIGDEEYIFRGVSFNGIPDTENVFKDITADNRAYTAFNITAFAGLDVYIYRGLYLGTELGFRIKTRFLDDAQFKYNNVTTTLKDNGLVTNVGFYVDPSIRFGYTF